MRCFDIYERERGGRHSGLSTSKMDYEVLKSGCSNVSFSVVYLLEVKGSVSATLETLRWRYDSQSRSRTTVGGIYLGTIDNIHNV